MPELDSKSISLTETVQKGGCAAKLPAGQLREILQELELSKPPSLILGAETMDDACLWSLANGQNLVQTLDFFTPIVDDPYDFGAIAAANAISDVYAMGGSPKLCLSILAFPTQTLPIEILKPLLRGALEKIHEAGACLAGGHTIDDDTLKFGLSVTGFVPADQAWTNAGARPGDVLILTKALGTGTITSALKRREVSDIIVAGAIESMKQLNNAPEMLTQIKPGESSGATDTIRIHAATDITGFGLAGHALQMARASNVNFHIDTQMVPVLPGARECIENKILNRAHRTNWEYVKNEVNADAVSDTTRLLMVDPQTSGGLLLAVSAECAAIVVERLKSRFRATDIIGKVVPAENNVRIVFF